MHVLERVFRQSQMDRAGVSLSAFLQSPLKAIAEAAASREYALWAERHLVSATKLRRLLKTPSQAFQADAVAYGEARRRAGAEQLMRFKNLA